MDFIVRTTRLSSCFPAGADVYGGRKEARREIGCRYAGSLPAGRQERQIDRSGSRGPDPEMPLDHREREGRLKRSDDAAQKRPWIMRAAGVMGSMTLLSRILGYLRDRILADLLGTGPLADAFYLAFRIPNTFRRLLGEGAMTAAFVPVFSEYRQKASSEELWSFVRRFFYAFALSVGALTLLGMIFARQITWVMARRFAHDPGYFDLTVRLTALMFPYLFLVCLAALAMAILNALDIFGPPAFTPVLL
ncbi:MAG: hypothetical protein D6795_13425, partial [Deltaproteobacteria bacterium]